MGVFLTRKEDKHENPIFPWGEKKGKKAVRLLEQTANYFKGLIIQVVFIFKFACLCLYINLT